MNPPVGLLSLGEDGIYHICSYLDPADIYTMAQVNQQLGTFIIQNKPMLPAASVLMLDAKPAGYTCRILPPAISEMSVSINDTMKMVSKRTAEQFDLSDVPPKAIVFLSLENMNPESIKNILAALHGRQCRILTLKIKDRQIPSIIPQQWEYLLTDLIHLKIHVKNIMAVTDKMLFPPSLFGKTPEKLDTLNVSVEGMYLSTLARASFDWLFSYEFMKNTSSISSPMGRKNQLQCLIKILEALNNNDWKDVIYPFEWEYTMDKNIQGKIKRMFNFTGFEIVAGQRTKNTGYVKKLSGNFIFISFNKKSVSIAGYRI